MKKRIAIVLVLICFAGFVFAGCNGTDYSDDIKALKDRITQLEQDLEAAKTAGGIQGDPGKSAYDLAVEKGYTGTLTEWLDSLNGSIGPDGKSAFDLAVEKGYGGTMTEWLASLVGAKGADGKSAYDLAVAAGFTGNESQWLTSLVGVNGKSAYEIAVEHGFEGTEAAWLASLKGEPGNDAGAIFYDWDNPIITTIEEVLAAYAIGYDAYMNLYYNKVVQITGKVNGKGNTFYGVTIDSLTVADFGDTGFLYCVFPTASGGSVFDGISIGQTVTIKGVGGGGFAAPRLNFMLYFCQLV